MRRGTNSADAPSHPISLSMQEAIRTALATNPELVALRRTEPVSAAALDVARTYPFNPQIGVDVRPFTREKSGNNAATLVTTSVQQEFELAHQGRYREQAGAADVERTRWSVRQAELGVVAQTEQRFFAALYQQQSRELAEQLAELNHQMLESLERRFEAGQASATDVALARIQDGTSRQQAELARAHSEAALAELMSQMGLPAGATVELVGSLAEWKWLPIPENWVADRPDVRAAQADVDAARARLELACADRVPNIKAGPVYEHDEAGTQFFGIEASIALPVLNTGEPLARQRRAELNQRLVVLEQLQLKAKVEVQAAMQQYERARQVTERYSADFWDKLADDVRRIEDQFAAGQTDLLRVYSARTSMIQSRTVYLDALQELARAAAAVTAATGLGPEAFLSMSPECQQ